MYLTPSSIYNYAALPTPPTMSQVLNTDNAVKSWWVVMSTSLSNNGLNAWFVWPTDEHPGSAWTAQQSIESRSILRIT